MFYVNQQNIQTIKIKREAHMSERQTIFDNWITDFRKILFCITVLALGTLFNIEEPKALAVAVIVQGASNIDNFWDYLSDNQICKLLKALIAVLILLSVLATIFAIFSLANSKGYFDTNINNYASRNIVIVVLATAFPIIPLITDAYYNIKKVPKNPLSAISEEEEYEL